MYDEKVLQEVSLVLKQISLAVYAERTSFFIVNSQRNTIESFYAEGIDNLIISVPLGRGIVGHVITHGCHLIENNAQESPLFDNSIDAQLNFQTNQIICVPVFDDKEFVVGAIECINSRKGHFNSADLKTLSALSATISLIVKNTMLYEIASQINKNYSRLLEVFGAVSSEVEFDRLIPIIMEKAALITGADRASLFLWDVESCELWSKYGTGLNAQIIRTKKGVVGHVASEGKSCIVNDPYENIYFDRSVDFKTGYRTHSLLTVPVFTSQGQILGVVQAINKQYGKFNESDLDILESFASQIRIAIENAQLFSQVNGMKNYLDILVQNLDNGIVTLDLKNVVQTANSTFFKMFDIPESQKIVGRRLTELDNRISDLLNYGTNNIVYGRKHYEHNLEIISFKNRKVYSNLSVLPMLDSSDTVIGRINLFHDVTKEIRIRANLNRYIPEHLVREVLDKDDMSLLKGQSQQCSILFSDIRNFTTLTEALGADQIVSLLNRYFDAMVTSINKHDGVLDKFIGDAVMAVFGVPYTTSRDAVNAVRCALEMLRIVEENRFKIGNYVKIGVGISTGTVVSGNIGSDQRYEYTVIGDSVNIASRLEKATKKYNSSLLICESTYNLVKQDFVCREVDDVLLEGKRKPIKIFSVAE